MSISTGQSAPDSINELVFDRADFDPTTADNQIGNATAYLEQKQSIPDGHIMAIHGVEMVVGDPNELANGNAFEMWVIEGRDNTPQNNWNEDYPNSLAYGQFESDNNAGQLDTNAQHKDFYGQYGVPKLNADGTFYLRWQYGGGGGGEFGAKIYHEFVPVDDDVLVRELAGQV